MVYDSGGIDAMIRNSADALDKTSHEGRTVKALPSMWRGNLDRKPYCLIGDYPETSSVA